MSVQGQAARRTALHSLWAAGVLGGLAQSLAGAAGALLAQQVGGSDALAGLPQTLLVAGSAAAALALSALTLRHGRGAALSAGASAALAGCVAVIAGAVESSLPFILVGSFLLGAGNTAVMLGRYAAADLGSGTSRAAAMSSVLVATTAGAVAGANLLAPATGLAAAVGLPALAGPYLVAAAGFAAAAGTLALGLRHLPAETIREAPVAVSPGLGRQGAAGLGVLALANLVMVSVMTMAPVQLHHSGSGLAVIGLVVSLHIAGMFAPSPLSAWLTDRYGSAQAAAGAGWLLIAACGLAALRARSPAVLALAMVTLGAGWNLALIAGSALLTVGVPSAQRPRREGWGEVGMGVAAASGAAASGMVMAGGGYPLLAVIGAAVAALVLPLAQRGTSDEAEA
jgi:MFS family permease